uniref:Homing endonuclease LAGLIDADG domain-containing protein n=1 Tax=Carteria lunzensis TaxID=160071 RepID=Q8SMM1_9CHLO|nr:unknown [Carteria lunzensis]
MNKFTPDQLLYLAGLIDGDGSIIAQLVSRKDYTWEFQIRLTVQVTQLKKRRWFLEELQKEIGAGSVRDRDTVSDYILTETSNVYKFLKDLQPHLRLKQKQANLVLRIIEQLPSSKASKEIFLELCNVVDHVATLNDTKKRKYTAEIVAAKLKELKECVVPVETSEETNSGI